MLSLITNYFSSSSHQAEPSIDETELLSLTTVPPEIAQLIWNQLNPKDTASVNQTCKQFRYALNDDKKFLGCRLKKQLLEIVQEKFKTLGCSWQEREFYMGVECFRNYPSYEPYSTNPRECYSHYPKTDFMVSYTIDGKSYSTTEKRPYKRFALEVDLKKGFDYLESRKQNVLYLKMILSTIERVDKKDFLRRRYNDATCDNIYYVEKVSIETLGEILPQEIKALIPALQEFVDRVVGDYVKSVKKQTMTENRVL